jgi:hypothetical protein
MKTGFYQITYDLCSLFSARQNACPNKKKDKIKKEMVVLKETRRCLNNIEQKLLNYFCTFSWHGHLLRG